MNGQPVWLASITLTDETTMLPILNATWSPALRERATGILRKALDGVGNQARERHFRMCSTLYIHRALTDDEAARLPPRVAEGLAGGPLEILWESEPGSESTKPCLNPHMWHHESGAEIPIDCGRCPSCVARARL